MAQPVAKQRMVIRNQYLHGDAPIEGLGAGGIRLFCFVVGALLMVCLAQPIPSFQHGLV
ncbi:MAG: hypothetical protein WDO24_19050 [Pseudomonadota bacterium]